MLVLDGKNIFSFIFSNSRTDFKSSKGASKTLLIPPKYLIKFPFNLGPNPSIPSRLDEKNSLDLLLLDD